MTSERLINAAYTAKCISRYVCKCGPQKSLSQRVVEALNVNVGGDPDCLVRFEIGHEKKARPLCYPFSGPTGTRSDCMINGRKGGFEEGDPVGLIDSVSSLEDFF